MIASSRTTFTLATGQSVIFKIGGSGTATVFVGSLPGQSYVVGQQEAFIGPFTASASVVVDVTNGSIEYVIDGDGVLEDQAPAIAAINERLNGTAKQPSLGPARIVTLGASITNGSSATNAGTTAYSPMIGNSASHRRMLRQVVYKGYPGQWASYIAAQVQDALALKPDVLILGPDFGTNGASSSATFAGMNTNYITPFMAVLTACRAVGVRLVACLTLPQGSEASDSSTHIGIRRQNAWLIQVAAKLGIDLIDTYTPMVSASTGYLNTSYYASGADPVHLNDAGHAALASAIATWIDANLSLIPWPAGLGVIGLNANPLMTGAGTTPDNWTVTVSPSTFAGTRTNALANPADSTDLPIGRWYSVNCDASASGAGTLYTGSAAFAVTPGETLLVFGYVKAEGVGIVRAITWNVTATTLHAILMQPTNGGASKPFFHEITVPAGCTSMRLAMQITTTTGQTAKGYIGACDVIRPSELGF